MTYKTLLTYGAKVSSVEQVYYSPVAELPQLPGIPLSSIYCVLAKNDPWTDENNPPQPTQDQASVKQFLKRVFVAKLIESSNISPVIQRINWVSGSEYESYDDTIDMFAVDQNGFLLNPFYIINRFDQVWKCLGNNNGGTSTIEPFFAPGTFNTNSIFQGVDGYKWKYIYTVDLGSKVKFMDATWIPVPVGQNTPNPLIDLRTNLPPPAGVGSIDVINVTNGGSGYDPANAVITVTVTGDGSGAVATANVINGSINDDIADFFYDHFRHEPLADMQVLPVKWLHQENKNYHWYDNKDAKKVAEFTKFKLYLNATCAVKNDFQEWQYFSGDVWNRRMKAMNSKGQIPPEFSMVLLIQLTQKAGYTYPGIDPDWYTAYTDGFSSWDVLRQEEKDLFV